MMMLQDKENINTDQLQCFTPKKSLRDIFSSISNSKISTVSPKKRGSPKRSPFKSPATKRVALAPHVPNVPHVPIETSRSSYLPKPETPSFKNNSMIKNEVLVEDPLNTSLAGYNFSYFRLPAELMPPPSPSFVPRTNFDFTTQFKPSPTSTSDVNSDYADNEEEREDPMAVDNQVNIPPILPSSVAHTLATSIANPFALPSSMPTSHSCSSLSSILNSTTTPSITTLESSKIKPVNTTNQNTIAAKLATPTKMRLPNPKTSAWAVPFKTPTKQQAQQQDADREPGLSGRFDEVLTEAEMDEIGIPRSTSLMSFPTFSQPDSTFPLFSNFSAKPLPSFPLSSSSSSTKKPTSELIFTNPFSTSSTSSSHSSREGRKLNFDRPSSKPLTSHPLPTEHKKKEEHKKEEQHKREEPKKEEFKILTYQVPSVKPLQNFPLDSSFQFPASSSSSSKPLSSFPLSTNLETSFQISSEEAKPKNTNLEASFILPTSEIGKQKLETSIRLPRFPSQEKLDSSSSSSFSFTRPSSIPKPTDQKKPTEQITSAIPKKAIPAPSKPKSALDLDSSFQISTTSKPKPSVDLLLNTSLQIPSKKSTPAGSSGKTSKSGIPAPTLIRRPGPTITPKQKSDNFLDSSFSSVRSSATKPSPAIPRPSLSTSTTPAKKRNASELDSSFSSVSSFSCFAPPSFAASSLTPTRKPRPSEIIHGTPSLTPSKSTHHATPKIDTASKNRSSVKTGIPTPSKKGKINTSSIPSASSLENTRVPSVKKAKTEDKPKPAPVIDAEFEQKLELALQAGTVGGNNSLRRTPEGGHKTEGPDSAGNKWSPIRKRALTFEESVLVCTKKTKNEL